MLSDLILIAEENDVHVHVHVKYNKNKILMEREFKLPLTFSSGKFSI
jgi:hypothetical protein